MQVRAKTRILTEEAGRGGGNLSEAINLLFPFPKCLRATREACACSGAFTAPFAAAGAGEHWAQRLSLLATYVKRSIIPTRANPAPARPNPALAQPNPGPAWPLPVQQHPEPARAISALARPNPAQA